MLYRSFIIASYAEIIACTKIQSMVMRKFIHIFIILVEGLLILYHFVS